MKTYLVTGGAGFIGGNFVKYILKKRDDIRVVILDKLTYAGNLGTIREELNDARTEFVKGDIGNRELVENLFTRHDIDVVVHFAAESHVDRSIRSKIRRSFFKPMFSGLRIYSMLPKNSGRRERTKTDIRFIVPERSFIMFRRMRFTVR